MYTPDGRIQQALFLVMLIVIKWLIAVRRLLCRHTWNHDLEQGTKKCDKCGKVEEVYMGWV